MLMGHSRRRSELLGRRAEREALDALVVGVRDGRGAVLVIRGEAGVGKTELLEYLVAHATGCRILRTAGVESEVELPFGCLHLLIRPLLDHLDRIPAPQRDALGTAFGMVSGDTPDRFMVGLAVLSLLAAVAEEQPLVCVVDDAQWLDRVSVQTLEFVARRLLAEPIALVFAVRDPGNAEYLAGLHELEVCGLVEDDARTLLSSAVTGPLDPRVRDRIVAETHGNPLALLELPRGQTPVELALGFDRADLMPVGNRIEQDYQQRLTLLPPQTRRLLLTAAAEPVGDVALLWRAAARLGVQVDAAPAKAAGLVEFGGGVRFRHPLVRSAVYRSARPEELRQVHQALAEATDPVADPDRRAWHAAHACAGPDESVAAQLVAAADRAQGRGGLAVTAALLSRAAMLTPDPARRGGRALDAAEAEQAAAAPDAAFELLAMAQLCPLNELQLARVQRLRAQIIFVRHRSSDAVPLFLTAARRLAKVDVGLARATFLEAIGAAIIVGSGNAAREAATAARAAPTRSQHASSMDLFLDGVASLLTDGYAAGVPGLRQALRSFSEEPLSDREMTLRWLLLAPLAQETSMHQLWDFATWDLVASRAVRLAREIGALSFLPGALMYEAGVHLHKGDLRAAAASIEESDTLTAATRYAPVRYASLNLAAWRGDEAATTKELDVALRDATSRGETILLGLAGYVTAVLYNGLGRYDLAVAGARQASDADNYGFAGWALVELVEAAARNGELEQAKAARALLAERTRDTDTEWALGIQARSDALLSRGDAADALYREAISRLQRSGVVVHVARAHLLYGEWLRRDNQPRQAREHLRTAHEMFHGMGADAFAERARRELRATGETIRSRRSANHEQLTAQESQIARLAEQGLTNPEIGARLFLSPHTVEWHLRKVFAKLNIHSRKQLGAALPHAPHTAEGF